eukprot:COSAG05_NODE_1482_length_4755_cov_52.621564_2_plen_518_part_00
MLYYYRRRAAAPVRAPPAAIIPRRVGSVAAAPTHHMALLVAAAAAAILGGGTAGRSEGWGAAWHAPFRHSWRSLEQQSFDFGNNPTSFDSAHELQLKSRYSVVFLDAGTGTGNTGADQGYKGCCNSSLPFGGNQCRAECDYVATATKQAAALKKVAANTSIWIYTSAFCTSTTYNSLSQIVDDQRYSGFWLDCVGSPPGRCPARKGSARLWDFRNASARAFFAQEWGTNIGANPSFDGVYGDSGDMGGCNPPPSASGHVFSQVEAEEIFNGTVLAWRAAALELNKAGKFFTVSLKNKFDSMPESATFPSAGSRCKGGLQAGRRHGAEDIIFELMGNDTRWIPFRQYNIPSKDFGKDSDGCVAAILNTAIEAGRGPSFICCNDANKTWDGGAGLNASLAAYLLNADDDSFFGPGSHWANAGWDPVYSDFPQLTQDLGPPLSPTFSRDGHFRFSRRFKNLDVALDCHPNPSCAELKTEATCNGSGEEWCGWVHQWVPVGQLAKGVCVDFPKPSFHWRQQ